MRNQPISPRVYTSPPSLQTNPTREERLTEIAYRLTDLSAELLELLTGPASDSHYPVTRYNQHSTATNQEEHREEARANRAQREILSAVKREEERETIVEPLHTNQVQQQLQLAEANLVRICTESSSAAGESKNSGGTEEIINPHLATTAPTPRHKNTTATSSSSNKQKCAKTVSSRATKHTNKSKQASPPQVTYNPGDQVQLIGGSAYKGRSATVVRDTGKQVCERVDKHIIYRKKTNLKKLNF